MGTKEAVSRAIGQQDSDEEQEMADPVNTIFSWKESIEKSTFAKKELDNTYVIEPVFTEGCVIWQLKVRQKGKEGVQYTTNGTIPFDEALEVDMGERARRELNMAMRILNTAIEVPYEPDAHPERKAVDDLFTIISEDTKPSIEEEQDMKQELKGKERKPICPECEYMSVYDRDTKTPTWRCRRCEATMEEPDWVWKEKEEE